MPRPMTVFSFSILRPLAGHPDTRPLKPPPAGAPGRGAPRRPHRAAHPIPPPAFTPSIASWRRNARAPGCPVNRPSMCRVTSCSRPPCLDMARHIRLERLHRGERIGVRGRLAEQYGIDLQQQLRLVIGGAAQHHAVDMVELRLHRRDVGNAAIDRHRHVAAGGPSADRRDHNPAAGYRGSPWARGPPATPCGHARSARRRRPRAPRRPARRAPLPGPARRHRCGTSP